jgi:hypothetical protein
VVAVIDLLHAINWKNSRLAQVLAILLVGTALGLLWILNDLAFTQGVIGWIVFVVVGLPLYLFATLMWDRTFLSEREGPSVGPALSWKRIGTGVVVALGLLLVASGVYLLAK